jgi:enoyl-[acyl-carrier protein] reductase I
MLQHVAKHSPIKKPITTEQVGNTVAFLASDLASGITGEIIFVDNGYHAMGVTAESSCK